MSDTLYSPPAYSVIQRLLLALVASNSKGIEIKVSSVSAKAQRYSMATCNGIDAAVTSDQQGLHVMQFG